MPNFAQVTLIGHLGLDPETKTTPSGDTVTSFSLATTRKRKDGEITTWWRCTMWGKRGETIRQYLGKGDPILVTGEPCLRTYTTKDGREGQAMEVEVRDWTFVGSKGDRSQNGASAPAQGQSAHPASAPAPSAGPADYDDAIPF